jgi:hypothetical protein
MPRASRKRLPCTSRPYASKFGAQASKFDRQRRDARSPKLNGGRVPAGANAWTTRPETARAKIASALGSGHAPLSPAITNENGDSTAAQSIRSAICR